MGWYLKQFLRDRRFHIAAGVGGASLVFIVLAVLINRSWAFGLAMYLFFPLLVFSILGMFAVLGLIVRADYLDRRGH